MSTVVVTINTRKLPHLRRFLKEAEGQMRVIRDEEDVMQKLVEEGMKSENVSLESIKKELLRNAGLR